MNELTGAVIILSVLFVVWFFVSTNTEAKVRRMENRFEEYRAQIREYNFSVSDRITRLEIEAGSSTSTSSSSSSSSADKYHYSQKESRLPSCLYCGTRIESDFKDLCPKCGAPLPRGATRIHDGGIVCRNTDGSITRLDGSVYKEAPRGAIIATQPLDAESYHKFAENCRIWSSK